MPRNYNDFERGSMGNEDERTGYRRRDEIRPEWEQSGRGRSRDRYLRQDSTQTRDAGRSRYGMSDYGINRGFEAEQSDYRFGSDVNSSSWYPRNTASYAPADSRDNLMSRSNNSSFNPSTESGADLYRESYTGRGPRGYKRSDERIKEDVCDMLEHNPRIDATEVEVDVKEGLVTLKGNIHDRSAKRLAEDLTLNCRGVRDVRNELSIDQSFWQRAKEAFVNATSDQSSQDISPRKSKH